MVGFAGDEESPRISAPAFNRDESGPILSVAISPVVMRASRDGRLKTKVMGVLPCHYDVLVVVTVVLRLFYYAPKGLEVVRVREMAFNRRGGKVCPESGVYILKQPRRYFLNSSEVFSEMFRSMGHLDPLFAVYT